MPRNLSASRVEAGPGIPLRRILGSHLSGVQRTPANRLHLGRIVLWKGAQAGVYGTAVTTPVWARLRPLQTSCTPPVASGVVTALPLMNLCGPASGFLQ
jgi:hypothetical protein